MAFTWKNGPVDRTQQYFELRHGDVSMDSSAEPLLIALVGRGDGVCFAVEWLVDLGDPAVLEAVEDAKRELDFYIRGGHASDAWVYLGYHAGTASNLYSTIHWILCEPGVR